MLQANFNRIYKVYEGALKVMKLISYHEVNNNKKTGSKQTDVQSQLSKLYLQTCKTYLN